MFLEFYCLSYLVLKFIKSKLRANVFAIWANSGVLHENCIHFHWFFRKTTHFFTLNILKLCVVHEIVDFDLSNIGQWLLWCQMFFHNGFHVNSASSLVIFNFSMSDKLRNASSLCFAQTLYFSRYCRKSFYIILFIKYKYKLPAKRLLFTTYTFKFFFRN